jgi:hypothetical protein
MKSIHRNGEIMMDNQTTVNELYIEASFLDRSLNVEVHTYEELQKNDGRIVIKCKGRVRNFDETFGKLFRQMNRVVKVFRKHDDKSHSSLLMVVEPIKWCPDDDEDEGWTTVELVHFQVDNDITNIENDVRIFNLQKQVDYQSKLIEELFSLKQKSVQGGLSNAEIANVIKLAQSDTKEQFKDMTVDAFTVEHTIKSIKLQYDDSCY